MRYLTDPTAFYLVGRVTVAALGALTALAVFHVGRRMFDARIGLGAAAIAAVAYFHTSASHVINVHVPMACALWTGIAAYLSYEASGKRRLLVIAGLLSGAAIALAYSATVGLAMLVCARALRLGSGRGALAGYGDSRRRGVAEHCADVARPAHRRGNAGPAFIAPDVAPSAGANVRSAIDSVTILQEHDWAGFVQLLFKPDDLLITGGAVAGILIGVWKRERWTTLLSGTAAILLPGRVGFAPRPVRVCTCCP